MLHQIVIFLSMLNGISALLSNQGPLCSGESVNYTCTVKAPSHTWLIGSQSIVVDMDVNESTSAPYTVSVIAVEGSFITSTLSVISFFGLNGTVLLCKDTDALPGQGEVQETTARVHDPLPSAPASVEVFDLNVAQNLSLHITKPLVSGPCVVRYTVRIYAGTDPFSRLFRRLVTIPVANRNELVTETVITFLNLCIFRYFFFVTPETILGAFGGTSAQATLKNQLKYTLRADSPRMIITPVDLESFNFTIFPPYIGGTCASRYDFNVWVNGILLPETFVRIHNPTPGQDLPFWAVRSGFDLCTGSYRFVAWTVGIDCGLHSRVHSPEPVDYLSPLLDIEISKFTVSIYGEPPPNNTFFMDPTATLTRSSVFTNTCVDQVFQEVTNDEIAQTDDLNCAFAGRKVNYCLQYTSSVCRSFVTMKSVQAPKLIEDIQIISSTTDHISMRVLVATCGGMEELKMVTTISNSSTTVTMQEANFSSKHLTLRPSISPGVYACSVTVFKGTRLLETQHVICVVHIALLAPAIIAVNFGGISANIIIITVGVMAFFYIRKRGLKNAEVKSDIDDKAVSPSVDNLDDDNEHNKKHAGSSLLHTLQQV